MKNYIKLQYDEEKNIIINNQRKISIPKDNWLLHLDIEKTPTIIKSYSLLMGVQLFLLILEIIIIVFISIASYANASSNFLNYYILAANLIKPEILYIPLIGLILPLFCLRKKQRKWVAKIKFHDELYQFILSKKETIEIYQLRNEQLKQLVDEAYANLDKIEIFVKREEGQL